MQPLAVQAWIGTMLAQQQDDTQLLLGPDFMPWMVLAFGAAMVIGPLFALVRPPADDTVATDDEGARTRPPLGRTVAMIIIGGIAAVWGLATLLS